MTKGNLSAAGVMRRANLPTNCSPIASTDDVKVLLYAAQVGNRATRRKATRNLLKALGNGKTATAVAEAIQVKGEFR